MVFPSPFVFDRNRFGFNKPFLSRRSSTPTAPPAVSSLVSCVVVDPYYCRQGGSFSSTQCGDGEAVPYVYDLASQTWLYQGTSGFRAILRADGTKWYLEGDGVGRFFQTADVTQVTGDPCTIFHATRWTLVGNCCPLGVGSNAFGTGGIRAPQTGQGGSASQFHYRIWNTGASFPELLSFESVNSATYRHVVRHNGTTEVKWSIEDTEITKTLAFSTVGYTAPVVYLARPNDSFLFGGRFYGGGVTFSNASDAERDTLKTWLRGLYP